MLRIGFVKNDNFEKALEEFIEKIVKPAKLCQYLGIIAEGFFGKWQPPLTKHNDHSSY